MLSQRINRVGGVEHMQLLAASVAEAAKGGLTLLLYGELGAGKTTFTQALAKSLGITQPVTSPTFTIAGEYEVTNHGSIRTLCHVDLYRFEGRQAQDDPLVREILEHAQDSNRLTVIEWADKLGRVDLPNVWKLTFMHGMNEGERIVDITQVNTLGL
ncbi:MAG: tRNA (adenosine(37)-N6)-threonylcarbamoyltransferase complex ATPase subunit type 1 TsaE [Candidatus Andersenbacteria bacterium]|nr:tRNA (adenosine(37)-N6)-threonylcarbamoyltransferase complex ATPase subunit type 1 TsaE [Candidatus Andersenbacteria bacterium]